MKLSRTHRLIAAAGAAILIASLPSVARAQCGGGGYYGHSRWGYGGGAGIGLGTILLIVLLVYLVGGIR